MGNVKACLAIGSLLVSAPAVAQLLGSSSGAIECGPTMPAAAVERMRAGVSEANAKILQQFRVLNQDMGARDRTPATDSAKAEVDRKVQELGSLIQIMQAGDRSQSALESASLLAAIREQTVYGGDRLAANARLSSALFTARQEAEKTYQFIHPALAALTLPGAAAQGARLRDAVEAVLKALGHCAPPSQDASRK